MVVDGSRILLLYLLRGIGKTKVRMGQNSWEFMDVHLPMVNRFGSIYKHTQNNQHCGDQIEYLHRIDMIYIYIYIYIYTHMYIYIYIHIGSYRVFFQGVPG